VRRIAELGAFGNNKYMKVHLLSLILLNIILALVMSLGSIPLTYTFQDTSIIISAQTNDHFLKRIHSADLGSLRADTTSLWSRFQRLNTARESVNSFALRLMWCAAFITTVNAIWCLVLLRKYAEQNAAANPCPPHT
jgi:hypothetical protein